MKNLTPALLFILFCFQVNAQNTFREGHYVVNSGDTITGFIKEYTWNENPEKIFFKAKLSDPQKTLEPEDILGFEISGRVKYKSARVEIDTSGNNSSDVSKNRSPDFVKKHLFLKILEEGEASLYQYQDGNLTRYFYSTEEVSLQPLIYRKYLDKDTKIKTNNDFRQQLLNSLKCEKLSESDFKTLKYWEIGLRKVIAKYNSCSNNTSYSYENEESKSSFHITVRPGFQLASLTTEEGSENIQTDFNIEASFRVGIEFEYILPFNNRKWSLILEPTYQTYSSKQERPFGNSLPTSREVDYKSVEVPLSFRYYLFLSSESQLFINGGLAYDINIGENKIIGNQGAELDLNGSFNPVFGLGFRFKQKFSFELRYQTSRDLLHENNFRKSTYSSFGFILGYRIL